MPGVASSILVCIPIYNDWPSAALLLRDLDRALAEHAIPASVLLIDDGSTDPPPNPWPDPLPHLHKIEILRLRRNLGHQRAIAIALAHAYADHTCRAVAVMDGDGEDPAAGMIPLIRRHDELDGQKIIFAARARRTESLLFLLFYHLFKLLHRVLTGKKVEVGNCSVVPRELLPRVVGLSELWNQYSAAIFKARIPTDLVPVARAKRLAGHSRMNFTALVTHGLSAMSVYGEEVGTRLLAATGLLTVLATIGLITVLALRLFTTLLIPTWALPLAALLLLIVLNALALCLVFAFVILHARNTATFLPLRDYRHYIMDVIDVTNVSHSKPQMHTDAHG